MTQKISILTLAIAATAQLEAERFIDVATGTYAVAAETATGVTATKAAIGELVPCDVLGTAVVTAGGEIDAGEFIQVGTSGKAVAATTGVVVGQALQAAAADGDRIEVLLIQSVPAPAGGG